MLRQIAPIVPLAVRASAARGPTRAAWAGGHAYGQAARCASGAQVPHQYDFVVVGGGGSGAVVASRLSEDPGTRVLLIEAGSAPPPASAIPAACASLQGTEVDWQFRDNTPGGISRGLVDQKMRLPVGKMLGGSTSINYMAYVRGHPADYDSWAAGGAKGWAYSDVLPYFKKSEGFTPTPGIKVDMDKHSTDGPLKVTNRRTPLAASDAFVKAAGRMGFTIGDYNGTDRATASRGVTNLHQFTVNTNGQRCGTYAAFLEPVMGSRENLTVVTGARASRVVVDKGAAVAVEYTTASGTESAAAAKEVVLSCGAYMTPHLLLRSGIGPGAELAAAGVESLVDAPHVGKHLKDHLMVVMPFAMESATPLGTLAAALGLLPDKTLFEQYLATGDGLPATSLYEASVFWNTGTSARTAHTHDAQLSFTNTAYNDGFWEGCLGVEDLQGTMQTDVMFDLAKGSAALVPQLVQPQSEGEVTLGGLGLSDLPVINNNYLASDADMKSFIAICKLAVDVHRELGKAEKLGEVCVPKKLASQHGGDLANDALWEAWIRHYATTVYHPTSTCRIGDVVDERCRVMGVRGLRVADASVMPNVPSGNTQAPCIMIGEKVAAMLAEDNSVTLAPA